MYRSSYAAYCVFLAASSLLSAATRASVIKLTSADLSATALVNNALFRQAAYNSVTSSASETFLALGHPEHGSEWGFNSTVAPTPQTLVARSLLLSDVPTTTINDVSYRQIELDVDAGSPHHHPVLLTDLRISLGASAAGPLGEASPVYSLGMKKRPAHLLISEGLKGQGGHGDLLIDIPDSSFSAVVSSGQLPNVYLSARLRHAHGTVASFSVAPPTSSPSPLDSAGIRPHNDDDIANFATDSDIPSGSDSGRTESDPSTEDPTQVLPSMTDSGEDHCSCTCHPHDPEHNPSTPEPGSALLLTTLSGAALLRRFRHR